MEERAESAALEHLLVEDGNDGATPLHPTPSPESRGATTFQGAVSVVNIVLGIGLLSMPYAMKLAGWTGIGAILLCTLLFCWSAKLLAYGLETIPAAVAPSYPSLGFAAFGIAGQHMVMALAAMELFGGCCLLTIVMWQTLGMFMPVSLSDGAVMLLVILIEAPLCVAGSFQSLSVFSVIGCVSTVAVTLLVVALPLIDPHQQELPQPARHAAVAPGLLPATGIFALSVAGHSCFPAVRRGMARPGDFHDALHIAYAIITAVLVSLCGAGYWYWGDLAHTLVTEDLELQSPYSHWTLLLPGLGIHKLVQLLVLLNVVTTIPLLVLSLKDIISGHLVPEVRSGRHKMLRWMERGIQVGILLVTCSVAFAARDILAVVESMVGALCSIMCSLMLPVLFYVAVFVRRREMTLRRWALVVGILGFGAFMLVLILVQDFKRIRSGAAAQHPDQNFLTSASMFMANLSS